MYGLPSDFDAGIFVGREFESVTFATNTMHLAFDSEVSLTVLNHLRYRALLDAELRDDVLPVVESGLMSLVGRRVERTETRSPGDLILEFEGGGMMWLEDDSANYESYSLTTPAGEVFV